MLISQMSINNHRSSKHTFVKKNCSMLTLSKVNPYKVSGSPYIFGQKLCHNIVFGLLSAIKITPNHQNILNINDKNHRVRRVTTNGDQKCCNSF